MFRIAIVCLFAFAHSTASAEEKSTASQRPNLLVIVADDMAHADLGIAGHPTVKTPNLDRLAADGVRFTHAFTPNPICTPSRAALLTGQDCWTNGCYYFGLKINEDSPHFARLLADAGYTTFFSGKWHNDGTPAERGFHAPGSIMVRGGPHVDPPVHDAAKKEKLDRPGFSTEIVTDAAVDFLQGTERKTEPWLAYVSYTAPHDPWTPPGKYAEMYDPEKIPLPANFLPTPAFRWFTPWHGTKLRDEALMPYPRTPAGVRDVRSRYLGMTTHVDHQVGRILDVLDKQQLAQNTLVVFVADHGISLGSHGFSGKQTMYEEGIRLPMILRDPHRQRGSTTRDELVSLIDVFPTLCEKAGIKTPEPVEGQSLLGLYSGNVQWPRKEIYAAFESPSHHRMRNRMVRTDRHKLIYHLTTEEVELYDLAQDPGEMQNLAGSPDRAGLQKKLWQKLTAWRKATEPPEVTAVPIPLVPLVPEEE